MKKIKNSKINGSMKVLSEKDAIFKINRNNFMNKYGLNSNDKEILFKGFFKLLETLNHEMKHYFQLKNNNNFIFNTNGISFSEALDYSYEDISRKVDSEFYKGKNGNYHNIKKEGDARRTVCLNTCRQLLHIVPILKDGNFLIFFSCDF